MTIDHSCAQHSVLTSDSREYSGDKKLSHSNEYAGGTKGHALCDFASLPEYLKDNEFIHRHYRANWPLKQTILSIFRIHNETGNIWTHLLGFFLFLFLTIYTTAHLPQVTKLPQVQEIQRQLRESSQLLNRVPQLPHLELLNLTTLQGKLPHFDFPSVEALRAALPHLDIPDLAALYSHLHFPNLTNLNLMFPNLHAPNLTALYHTALLHLDQPPLLLKHWYGVALHQLHMEDSAGSVQLRDCPAGNLQEDGSEPGLGPGQMANSTYTRIGEQAPSYCPIPSTSLSPIPRWPFYLFLAGAMTCLLSSSTCHLLSCHSAHVSRIIWRFDYAGIAVLITSSFFPPVYYGFLCHPWVRTTYLVAISLMGVATVLVSLIPKFQTPRFRPIRAGLFFGMGVSGVVPCFHKLLFFSHEPIAVTTTVLEVTMGVLYGVGALFYATRVPERWLPGKFDIAGHSHQIFHVLVVAGAYTHYCTGLLYLQWRDAHGCGA